MSKKINQWLIWLGLMCLGLPASAAQEIQLLTYYNVLPYAVDGVAPADSYTVRLAQWLSQQSAGRYQFVPRQVPKKRLLHMMTKPNWLGVVAWVNPLWVEDAQRQRYLWSSSLMHDRDLRVSRQADKVVFDQGRPLQSARFGGISGHLYPSLEAQFKAGLLTREDAQNELSNVLKLQHKRVDVILLQASSLSHIRAEVPDFDRWAYVDPQPQAKFERFLFTSRSHPELMAFINQVLPKLMQDPAWVAALRPSEQ
jgi:polar amino acid transport system substrate-binding protein